MLNLQILSRYQNMLVLLKGKEREPLISILPGTDVMMNFQDIKGKVKPYQVKQILKVIDEKKITRRG